PVDAPLGAAPRHALLDVDRVAQVHVGGELGVARLAEAGVRVGGGGAVARAASRAHRAPRDRARRRGSHPDRTRGREAVARRRRGGGGGRERDRVAGTRHTRGAGVLDGDRRLTRAGGDRDVVEDRTGDGAWPCGLNSSGGGRSKPGTTSTSPWSTGPASSLPTWAIPTSSPTGARRRSRSRPCRSPRTGCSSGSPSRLKSSRCAARRTRASRSTWR